MALNFQPYDDAAGREIRARWSGGLDGIINQYLAAKQNAEGRGLRDLQAQGLRQQLAAGDRTAMLQNVTETAQFGAPLQSFPQQQVQQAALGQEAPYVLSPDRVNVFNRLKEGLLKLGGRDQGTLDLKAAQLREQNAKAAQAEAKATGAPGGLDLGDRAKIEAGLYDDYRNAQPVKNFTQIRDAYRNVAALAKSPSGINDVGIVYSLVKMLDPNSAVREGEIALSNSATPLAQKIATAWNNAAQGRVSADEKNRLILSAAESLYNESKKGADAERSAIGRRGAQYGVNQDIVLPDLSIPGDEMNKLRGSDPQSIIRQMSSQGKSREEIKAALKAAGH